jgi:hypothetical protein
MKGEACEDRRVGESMVEAHFFEMPYSASCFGSHLDRTKIGSLVVGHQSKTAEEFIRETSR